MAKVVISDCSKIINDRDCKLKMIAPVDQREDLLDAVVAHAVKSHGHQETQELRDDLNASLEVSEE